MFKNFFLLLAIITINSCDSSIANEVQPMQSNSPRAKNIILLIGDGMGVSQITAGLYANGNHLEIERFKHMGLVKCHSSNNLITDSAASGTAFATGIKTFNGAVGVNPNREPVKNIVEYAEEKGLATGLVVTSQMAHATPAAFFGHHHKRSLMEDIAAQLLDQDIDLLIGGGQNHFENRKDNQNISKKLRKKGYQVHSFMDKALTEIEADPQQNLLYFTAAGLPLPKHQGRDYLPFAMDFSIDFLQKKSKKGFFLMVEGSQIDLGGHAKNSDFIISEMLEFDEIVGKALDFAEEDGNTLVILGADHETGGYAINYGSTEDNFKAGFTSDYHTATMVPIFAYGPGAEDFTGIFDNTQVFFKMMDAYGWNVD